MSIIERYPEIVLKALMAREEFNDPISMCAGWALDGLVGGRLPYQMWQILAEQGVDELGLYRVINQVVAPMLDKRGQVSFCRGDQIADRDIFSGNLSARITTEPSRLLVATIGEGSGHALSFVSKPPVVIEFNAMSSEYIDEVTLERVQKVLHESLEEPLCHLYGVGFRLSS